MFYLNIINFNNYLIEFPSNVFLCKNTHTNQFHGFEQNCVQILQNARKKTRERGSMESRDDKNCLLKVFIMQGSRVQLSFCCFFHLLYLFVFDQMVLLQCGIWIDFYLIKSDKFTIFFYKSHYFDLEKNITLIWSILFLNLLSSSIKKKLKCMTLKKLGIIICN